MCTRQSIPLRTQDVVVARGRWLDSTSPLAENEDGRRLQELRNLHFVGSLSSWFGPTIKKSPSESAPVAASGPDSTGTQWPAESGTS